MCLSGYGSRFDDGGGDFINQAGRLSSIGAISLKYISNDQFTEQCLAVRHNHSPSFWRWSGPYSGMLWRVVLGHIK
jgi:hypothetical protein